MLLSRIVFPRTIIPKYSSFISTWYEFVDFDMRCTSEASNVTLIVLALAHNNAYGMAQNCVTVALKLQLSDKELTVLSCEL